MTRGYTLLETLLALVIAGLAATMSLPAWHGLHDSYTVRAAAAMIASAHQRARIRAVLEGGSTELEVRADSLLLRVLPGGGQVPRLVWSGPGPATSGVSFQSPPRTIAFAPTGVTTGFANATFVVSKGAARRQVVISRMGRVRVIP